MSLGNSTAALPTICKKLDLANAQVRDTMPKLHFWFVCFLITEHGYDKRTVTQIALWYRNRSLCFPDTHVSEFWLTRGGRKQ